MRFLCLCAALLLWYGCSKTNDALPDAGTPSSEDFKKYTIRAGQHYADEKAFVPVETSELQFLVRFDSSAVYQSTDPENQYDINKLYGFSDNGGLHQQYSARFGWRWSDGALRLFAYVYNGGDVASEEITTVAIGTDARCAIKVTADQYLFYCNEVIKQMPRQSKTAKGKGYLLYPYFGGNEPAPHDVSVWIKNL